MHGRRRRACSTASGSKDGPKPIENRTQMSSGVDREAAVRALRAAGAAPRRRLARDLLGLLGAGPETSRRQLGLIDPLLNEGLPSHDHKHATALVIAQPELADHPLDRTRLDQ